MRKTIILMVFVTLVSMLVKTEAFQRYCGKTLTDTMKMICRKGFNGKPLKRNSILDSTNKFDYNSLANDITSLNMSESSKSLQYPGLTFTIHSMHIVLPPHALNLILSKLYNNMMLTQTRRQRRSPSLDGIYYECCLKACSTTEMIAYCL